MIELGFIIMSKNKYLQSLPLVNRNYYFCICCHKKVNIYKIYLEFIEIIIFAFIAKESSGPHEINEKIT